MGERKAVPSIEGWFTEGEKPHLIGTQCKQCRTYFFPKQDLFCKNPSCQSTEFDEVELSRTGKIWSYENWESDLSATFTVSDSLYGFIDDGDRLRIAVADLDDVSGDG